MTSARREFAMHRRPKSIRRRWTLIRRQIGRRREEPRLEPIVIVEIDRSEASSGRAWHRDAIPRIC